MDDVLDPYTGEPRRVRDRCAALVRRQPWMVEHPVGVAELFWPVLGSTLAWGVFGALLMLPFTSAVEPLFVLVLAARPYGRAHLEGPRHRWAALAAAAAVGWTVGALIVALLPDSPWSVLAGVCAGNLAAVVPYALVTQAGRPRLERAA